jgi:N-acetylglucosamine-6-phosphate deacetylase
MLDLKASGRNSLMGFFDLQVNGYAGVDFNGDSLDAPALEAVCRRLESQGVEGILATVITDSLPVMEARLGKLVCLLEQHPSLRRVIRGVHIEGPFISPDAGYRGAHPVDAITAADVSVMDRLLTAAGGLTRLVTLAPECDPGLKVARMLAAQGIVVSAGHTNASLEQLRAAIDAGVTMITHLGNGCPALVPRHDNFLQRAFSLREHFWLCFIADGVHIPFFALRNYFDLVGFDKAIVVTDAIVAADLGPGLYRFGRWELEIKEDLVARPPDNSHLVGSTVTMQRTYQNLTERVGISSSDALKLLELNPQVALGNKHSSPMKAH